MVVTGICQFRIIFINCNMTDVNINKIERRMDMNKISNWLWGIVLIVIGVVLGLNALDITKIKIFFDGWWTLFIIVPCFIGLFKEKKKTVNLIGLLIGICLLLGCLNLIKFDLIWKLLFPAVLIIIGLSFLFKDCFNHKVNQELKKLNKNKNNDYCATFGGQDIEFNNEKFDGCSLTAVFGGLECDLRDAIIDTDVVIDVSAIFGGITIYVPDDVKVKITSTQIFGGVSDERKKKNKDAEKTLYIKATSLFGGVDIK